MGTPPPITSVSQTNPNISLKASNQQWRTGTPYESGVVSGACACEMSVGCSLTPESCHAGTYLDEDICSCRYVFVKINQSLDEAGNAGSMCNRVYKPKYFKFVFMLPLFFRLANSFLQLVQNYSSHESARSAVECFPQICLAAPPPSNTSHLPTRTCTACQPGHYAAIECSSDHDSHCSPCSECAPGQFELKKCSASRDTVCHVLELKVCCVLLVTEHVSWQALVVCIARFLFYMFCIALFV